VQPADPQDTVELWTIDQHRIGLKPILRRLWSPRGQRPGALVQHRYQGGYREAFGHPGSGRTWWWFRPTVSSAALMLARAEVAHALGAGRGQQSRLVLDRAGWHVRPQVQGPAGIPLHFLPPDSPELQPADRLWPLTNEALANRHFHALDDLHTGQAPRCLQRQERPAVIAAYTPFHWWPQSA
jgi:hypothetical protein